MSVYIDNIETEFLPLNCNWIASNMLPKFDENQKTFVEPFLPNYKINPFGSWHMERQKRHAC